MMEMESCERGLTHCLWPSSPPRCLSAEHVSPADCADDLQGETSSALRQTVDNVHVQAHVTPKQRGHSRPQIMCGLDCVRKLHLQP